MALILVLDDVADAGAMVRKILQRKGHEVRVFSDEDEALRFAAANAIDLAILDMKLRKMEGTEVLAELRKLHPELPVIMLTGFPTKTAASQAMALGALAYCAKPIDKGDLERIVEGAISQGWVDAGGA
ncbi:MAG: response regulator [Thermodesulfobacteriota bacterium]